MSGEHLASVESAYKFAKNTHEGQLRISGQPYIIHSTQVAETLAALRLDPDTAAASYLHDTVENTPVTNGDIKEKFGKDVAFIVDGITKLSKIQYKPKSHEEYLADNHRKMLIAMVRDLWVIVVKLADRLCNIHTLDHLRSDEQRRIIDETLDIYASLADRLDIGIIKWELENMSLHYLNPQQYYRIVNLMQSKWGKREGYIADTVKTLKQTLDGLGVRYEIYGRPKHIYSTYKKMVSKHKDLNETYDLLTVHAIVKSVHDCYAVLDAVHTKWRSIPGRFKDYIAVPKVNGYQSLHTTVIGPGSEPLEIQIRTEAMHQVAEYGVAAHWAYKKGVKSEVEQTNADKRLNMFQEILEFQDETKDSHEFIKGVKTDIFSDHVCAFTPKGNVYELPEGLVPLDFAYVVHLEVGAHSVDAKINDKVVPLDCKPRNSDVVEMLTQTSARPSRDWVGLVRASRARNKIEHFFKAGDREEDIEKGQDFIEQELPNCDSVPGEFMDREHIQKAANHFNYHNEEEMFATVGYGEISVATAANQLTEDLRKKAENGRQRQLEERIMDAGRQSSTKEDDSSDAPAGVMRVEHSDGVMVRGISDLILYLAKCCNPVPGDLIIGYITKGRGITVHRINCPGITEEARKQGRSIGVAWENIARDEDKENYNADIEIYSFNRSHPLNDVVNALNSKTGNIVNISGKVDSSNMAHIYAAVSVRDAAHLEDILSRMRDMPNVYEAKRSVD